MLTFAAVVVVIFTACQQIDFNSEINANNEGATSSNPQFNVSLNMVKTFLSISNGNDETLSNVQQIQPIAYGGDTLMYIVNYKDAGGWEIISADRRTPIVLGSDSAGSFKISNLHSGTFTWVDELAENIYNLKHSNSQADTTGFEYQLWSNIELLIEYRNEETTDSRNGETTIMAIPKPPVGETEISYWKLVDIRTESMPSTQVGPLLPTKWGQGAPWNVNVLSNRDGTKCPTGCVAVAGAQTLRYLHYHINKPVSTYSEGGYTGWIDYSGLFTESSYILHLRNENSTTWDFMALDYAEPKVRTDRVATLMAYVGNGVNMKYKIEGSGAQITDLHTFIKSLGINCNFGDYNSSTVIASLSSRIPVIVGAFRKDGYHYILGIPTTQKKAGHAWVIDGYESRRTKYISTYVWATTTSDGTTTTYPPTIQRAPQADTWKVEESISSVNYLIMNWGWDGSQDGGRYALAGDWVSHSSGEGYNIDREIIYGFK